MTRRKKRRSVTLRSSSSRRPSPIRRSISADLSDEPVDSELVQPGAVTSTDWADAAGAVCKAGEWRTQTESPGGDCCPLRAGVPGEELTLDRRWYCTAPSPPSCGCEEWEYQFYSCYKCILP